MKDDILADDDFEKLLDSFINTSFDETEKPQKAVSTENVESNKTKESLMQFSPKVSEQAEPAEETDDDDDDDDDDGGLLKLSEQDQQISQEMNQQDLDENLLSTLSDAKKEAAAVDEQPELGNDESELAQAFVNFYTSVNRLSMRLLNEEYQCQFEIDDLYPNYKPSIGQILSDDLITGWRLLIKMFPNEVGKFPPSSTDEQFLSFAETLHDPDLQLAIISYVEILIDMESCELMYQAKFIKYQERHIKRIMYEEYLARKERQRKFTEALEKKHFPVDAERLISNYFRVAQKDLDGAFQALTTNPAIFSPIDFGKIKPRFFGLIKVSPKDGIRINTEMGNFLKRLKV